MGDTIDESQDTSQDCEELKKETALAGYQAAISLWTYQGGQVGARFNIMLVANSIVVAAITMSRANQEAQLAYAKSLPIIGFILCILWFLLMKRETGYADYFINSARELEEQYLDPIVKTVSRGASFGKGDPIMLEIKDDEKEKKLQMSYWGRFSAKNILYSIILSFGLLYLWFFLRPFVVTEKFINSVSHLLPF